MPIRIALVCALVALAATAPSASAAGPCAGADVIAATEQERRDASAAILCLVNAERARHGLSAVRTSRKLARAAQALSADMTRHLYVGHVDSSGRNVRQRVARTGYSRRLLGEAIGWGTGARRSPAALVRGIMASSAHRRIVLGSRFRDLGVGLTLGAPAAGKPNGATAVLTLGLRK